MRIKRYSWLILLLAFAMVVAACGSDDDGGDTTTTTAAETTTTAGGGAEETTTTTTAAPGAEVMTDIGVDAESKTITIGLLADLTGIFSPLVIDIADAQQVYFDTVNAAGGLADGWTVELLVEDTNYNVEQHMQKFEELVPHVAAFSQSTGSPTSVAALPRAAEEGVMYLPLSWYSGWAFPEFDQGLAFEQNTNYCAEAMNLISFAAANGAQSVAIATFPGDYGFDGAAGAKIAIEELGLTLAYDGAGAVIPGQDQTEVVTGIVGSGADWVFLTTNATTTAELMGGAAAAGFQAMWTGSSPSYDFRLLDTPVAPLIDAAFYQSAYNVAWGTDVPGLAEIEEAMTAAYPDRRPSDAFIIGWNEGVAMAAVLEQAIANGDLTRAGILAASNSIPLISFNGTQPDRTAEGTPNDYIVRESFIFKPSLEAYTAAGGAEQTLSQEGGGTTGSELVEELYVGDVTAAYDFVAPCYEL